MTNVTGTVIAGSVSTTFTGTTNDPVVAGTPFAGTITAVAPPPPPPPPTTINVGVTTIQTNSDSGNGNLLVAQPIALTQVATIQSLSFYVKTIGGALRLGLYSGTKPTTLVAQTASFTPIAGWNTQPVVTPVSCPIGPYFLAYLPASSTLGFVNSNVGGTSYFKPFTFGAMPSTFPALPSTTASNWSFYGTFSTAPPSPPPPPPPPGVPIGIGLSSVSVGVPPNANNVVGIVSVTDSDGGPYPGQIILGGTDAAMFLLTNGGLLPCNLVVGSVDIPTGTYNITLTAN
jgi:hypothetical protein